MSDLASQIEAYLRAQRRWVPAAELCRHFSIKQRALRGLRGKEGLCSKFAISGDKGYRHAQHCTEAEFTRFHARIGDHAINELRRRRTLKRLRQNLLTPTDLFSTS